MNTVPPAKWLDALRLGVSPDGMKHSDIQGTSNRLRLEVLSDDLRIYSHSLLLRGLVV